MRNLQELHVAVLAYNRSMRTIIVRHKAQCLHVEGGTTCLALVRAASSRAGIAAGPPCRSSHSVATTHNLSAFMNLVDI